MTYFPCSPKTGMTIMVVRSTCLMKGRGKGGAFSGLHKASDDLYRRWLKVFKVFRGVSGPPMFGRLAASLALGCSFGGSGFLLGRYTLPVAVVENICEERSGLIAEASCDCDSEVEEDTDQSPSEYISLPISW